jgi:Domain of unknown function (DUF397)
MSIPDQAARGYRWRKARRSANDGACIEVALVNSEVAVRDSKDPCSCWLRYSRRSWRDFTSNIKTKGVIPLPER